MSKAPTDGQKPNANESGHVAFHCLERSVTSFSYSLEKGYMPTNAEKILHEAMKNVYSKAIEAGYTPLTQDQVNEIYSDPKKLEHDLKYFRRSDNALQQITAAAGNGTTQALHLGAGFDPSTIMSTLINPKLRHAEIDLPEVSELKYSFADGMARSINFTGADLTKTKMDEAFNATGLDVNQKTCVIMYGLISHLPKEATEGIFKFLAKLPKGSEIRFNFYDSPATTELNNQPLQVTSTSAAELKAGLAKLGYSFEFDSAASQGHADPSKYAVAVKGKLQQRSFKERATRLGTAELGLN